MPSGLAKRRRGVMSLMVMLEQIINFPAARLLKFTSEEKRDVGADARLIESPGE